MRQVDAAFWFSKPSQRWFAQLERQFNGEIMKGTGLVLRARDKVDRGGVCLLGGLCHGRRDRAHISLVALVNRENTEGDESDSIFYDSAVALWERWDRGSPC